MLIILFNLKIALIEHAILLDPTIMEHIIHLLEVIIWPLTVIVGLLFFKKHIGKIIGSLGSIKAGAQGIEMNFIDEKLKEATKLIGTNGVEAKSGGTIITKGSHAVTPYQELLEIRDALTNKIRDKARENNIPTDNLSSLALADKLVENNIITRQSGRHFSMLMDLTNIGTHSITQLQVNQIKALYNHLSI